ALALILGSPELQLEGVTCVYGDVALRGRMAQKLLSLAGCGDVPVRVGSSKPLLGLRPVYWAGHEGEGLLGPGDENIPLSEEHAVDFLIRSVMNSPGQIHLIAIGPLTNVALALLEEPRLAQALAHLTIMGGAVRGTDRLDLPYAEHNIRSDPEAAHVVFRSGAPTTLVPLDVTTRVGISREGLARLRGVGSPFHQAIAEQVALYPRFQARGYTNTHDPLAVATVIQPDLVELETLHVDLELAGQHAVGATLVRAPTESAPANVGLALKVDVERFESFLIERLSKSA
ncbi:MAG TPA: nucleoside hydrolase, partial [Chloroflexota bacterium]|nr:nucleoside hydrolase [Chloroflexota bacterium]